METTPYSKAQLAALNASLGELVKPGWVDGAVIREAVEDSSARGNTMIVLGVAVPVDGGHGGERFYKDYLTNTPRGATRLHSACEAVGALDRYNARTISPEDFIGKVVRVKLSVERGNKRYAPRNIIEDYAVSEARVVNLRGAAS
jgi:hypothetical protein